MGTRSTGWLGAYAGIAIVSLGLMACADSKPTPFNSRISSETTALTLCGKVNAFAAASANARGSVTIAGYEMSLGSAVSLLNEIALRLDANVCAALTLDALGDATSGSVATDFRATARVHVCGVVHGYTAATATKTGSLWIGYPQFVIAKGATLANAAALVIDAYACVDANLDVDGAIGGGTGSTPTQPVLVDMTPGTPTEPTPSPDLATIPSDMGEVPAEPAPDPGNPPTGAVDLASPVYVPILPTELTICGNLEAFVAATSSTLGLLAIDGNHFLLGQGVSLVDALLLQLGVDVCVTLSIGINGHVNAASLVANLLATARVHVCGTVNAYTKATATSDGALWIGFPHFVIAAGSVIDGDAALGVHARVCIDASLDAAARITVGKVTSE